MANNNPNHLNSSIGSVKARSSASPAHCANTAPKQHAGFIEQAPPPPATAIHHRLSNTQVMLDATEMRVDQLSLSIIGQSFILEDTSSYTSDVEGQTARIYNRLGAVNEQLLTLLERLNG